MLWRRMRRRTERSRSRPVNRNRLATSASTSGSGTTGLASEPTVGEKHTQLAERRYRFTHERVRAADETQRVEPVVQHRLEMRSPDAAGEGYLRTGLVPPVSPACISSPYGPRVLAHLPQAGTYHYGVDLPAPQGAAVVVNGLGGSRDGKGGAHSMADQVVKEIQAAGGQAVANYDSVATVQGGESICKTGRAAASSSCASVGWRGVSAAGERAARPSRLVATVACRNAPSFTIGRLTGSSLRYFS